MHNRDGPGRFVFSVDHASNAVPVHLADLGLGERELASHIAWDPGALELARRLADALDAPLVHPGVSRLVIDANRDPAARDSIVERSDGVTIPGNLALDAEARSERVARYYEPFHRALERLVVERVEAGLGPILVSVHSFAPVLAGRERPWDIGVIHDHAREVADMLIDTLGREAGLVVGRNEPYAPADGVYHTLSVHGEAHGIECAMLELRADCIADSAGLERWARRLGTALAGYGGLTRR